LSSQPFKNVLLVDHENRHNLDLSALDSSYRVIIFVGVNQNSDKLQKRIKLKSPKSQVEFLNVMGAGKNGLDFHIAFKLGQLAETENGINTYILSADKGFDPLILHLNSIQKPCKRIEAISELPVPLLNYGVVADNPIDTLCFRCKTANTIEHNGGRWCTNCGHFATPPDPRITGQYKQPSSAKGQPAFAFLHCADCGCSMDTGDGIYDDGEWVCFSCLGVD
jgi:hypothetical protein